LMNREMDGQCLDRQKKGKSLEKQADVEHKQRASDSIASEFIYAAVDPNRDYGFVAVAAGEGLKAVFTDLAVDAVVSGRQTMNPATEDILAAVQSVPAKTVLDRKSTRLNSSHVSISYAVFCLK